MKKAKKTKLFSFDTEDDGKGNAFLFVFYDVEEKKFFEFQNRLDAIDFVCGQSDSVFWACNLQYDLQNLFLGYYSLLSFTFAGSRVLMAEMIDDRGGRSDNIKFFDTLNHWLISVKEMGKRIGLEKFEMKHTGSTRVTKKMLEYCKRDTEIVGVFVDTMTKVYDRMGCKLKMTIASTTLDFFERKFYKRVTHHFTQEQIDFFHEGYYGGRTEIFFTKPIHGRIFYHDVNSLYPYCLKEFEFPSLDTFIELNSPGDADFQNNEGMAKVKIRSPDDLNIPYLPAKHDKKLVFPLGEWVGVYTYFEIREALKLGYKVLEVTRAIESDSRCRPFVKFVSDIYRLRRESKEKGDELMQLTYKALLNYAYGKFAQGNEVVKLVPARTHTMRAGDTLLFDMVLTKEKEKYPRYANCVWAAYVTSYARHTLYKGLRLISDDKAATLLYCDTDSVLYKARAQKIPDSKELGDFKFEDEFDFAHFKLPKLYALGKLGKINYKAKGVPVEAREKYFEKGNATFKRPNKMRETMRRNSSPKRSVPIIPNFWELRDKSINQKYDKRIEISDSGLTKPLVLDTKLEIGNSKKKERKNEKRNCKTRIQKSNRKGASDASREEGLGIRGPIYDY